MPNNAPGVENTFSALSDPTRRAVVQALSKGSATVSELAGSFDMALPSFTQHLGVLENAGLIVSHKQGRSRVCALNPSALKAAEDWLASYRREWEQRLDRLALHLDRVKEGEIE
ncbi:ArsR/SmtB family transcription factor [Paracoccus pacificus]|uniref:ArsR/SmtB family transcription factor n=1 Tax=Paracoccus pacificus TaxID=1463598 RepID=A0ABW4R886_9RHOB